MLNTRQRLGEEVGDIDVARHVNDAKLTLADTVLKPVEPHVDAFRHAGGHRFVGECDSTLVVAIDESGLLGVAEVVQDTALRVGDPQRRKETRVLCLLDCRADHRDESGVAGQWPIDEVQRVGVEPGVRGEAKKMEGAGDGARTRPRQVRGVREDRQHHVGRPINPGAVAMRRDVSEEPVQLLEGSESSCGLLAGQRTRCRQNPGVHRPPVVQEVPDSDLELFPLSGRGWGFRVNCRSLREGDTKAGGGINKGGRTGFDTFWSQPGEQSVDVTRVGDG